MINQLWLGRKIRHGERGPYLSGACGREQVVVELDQSILRALPEGELDAAISGAYSQIQAAARRKWNSGDARPRHHFHSDRLKHMVIALTDEDLGQAEV